MSARKPKSELLVILLAIGILLILFVPVAPFVLDVLLILNFSWALTVLLLTFFTDKPLAFSTFPPLLLLSTLFRLGLNVSATRLILADAHAGRVIEAMGAHVIRGNYVMGLVVFFILVVVQYVVVSNGAQRVAEVAARFTLDSLPGKQMSIDADLNMGLVSREQAQERRRQIEREASFYGAMDGASKFVKGDAIAGILILLINILGGFAIGMAQKGMSLQEALETYTLLTAGDGLVTQIPALIISIATGIIVTRAATDSHLGEAVSRQIAAFPGALVLVCMALCGFLTISGMPLLPVLLVLGIFAVSARFASRLKPEAETPRLTPAESLNNRLRIHPVDILMHPRLHETLLQTEALFVERIGRLREQTALELGVILPEVRFLPETRLTWPHYQIVLQGNARPTHPLYPEKVLVLLNPGDRQHQATWLQGAGVRDPAFGLPAVWCAPDIRTEAQVRGLRVQEPPEVLLAHLHETLKDALPELLTREETLRLLDNSSLHSLRDELIPALMSTGQVMRVLQKLLDEKVSIRPLETILEVLLEHAKTSSDPALLAELVRVRLSDAICTRLAGGQAFLSVLTLAPGLEQQLANAFTSNGWAPSPALTEHFLRALAREVENMLGTRRRPILLCSSIIRRHVRELTRRILPHLSVLAMNEIPVSLQVESFATLDTEQELIDA